MKNYDNGVVDSDTRRFSLRGAEFTAKPVMPGDAFDDLADIQSGRSDDVRLFAAFASIIRRTLINDDRARWDELLAADLDIPIDARTLATIADDLVTVVTGRPPEQQSSSGSPDETTGTTSTESSGSEAAPVSPTST